MPARWGERVLKGKRCQQIDLVDYRISQLGQEDHTDQFAAVFDQLKQADWIVLGTPVYWHDISGYLKTLIERISQTTDFEEALRDKQISVLVQGADPSDTIGPVTHIITRFAHVAGMTFADLEDR
ncbi:hypothetical protein AB656_02150 [Bifidobacterium actinocoloniiforme DSM 22766]|nr:hypothetical protein AB656_02150 [Bifidobacterium actinocoloniiforme DSM 22766]